MDNDLPTYESSGPRPPVVVHPKEYPTKHSFVQVLSHGSCTITIASRAATHGYPPSFYPGDTVSGVIELVLSKKLSLKALEVRVSVWISALESQFLESRAALS